MTDLDPFLRSAGAAIRGIELDPPAAVDALRRRVRKRRRRRRAVTIAAVSAAIAVVAVFFTVILRPGPHRVITTGPRPASVTPPGRPVALPIVTHARTWSTLDIGRLRLFVPPHWEINTGPPDCNDNDGNLATLAYTKPPRSCAYHPSVYLTVRSGVVHAPSGQRSQLHGVSIWTSRIGAGTTVIAIPALRSTLTAHGSQSLTIARTLGPSSLQALLSMTGPIAVPRGWKPVRYQGIQVDVPSAWKIATVPYDCGTLFMGASTAYTGPALGAAGCMFVMGNELYQPHDGIWLQPAPRNLAEPSRYPWEYNHAQIDVQPGVNSNGGAANVPIAYVIIRTKTTTITATLGLGTDPLTAERILSSIRSAINR